MGNMFSKPRAPEPPKVDDTALKEAEEEAKRKERLVQRKKAGRAATILTGGQGVTNEAFLKKKTLLGE